MRLQQSWSPCEKKSPLCNLTDVIFHWSLLRYSALDSLQPRGQSAALATGANSTPALGGGLNVRPKDTSAGRRHADMCGCQPRVLQPQGTALPETNSELMTLIYLLLGVYLFIYYSNNRDLMPLWTRDSVKLILSVTQHLTSSTEASPLKRAALNTSASHLLLLIPWSPHNYY